MWIHVCVCVLFLRVVLSGLEVWVAACVLSAWRVSDHTCTISQDGLHVRSVGTRTEALPPRSHTRHRQLDCFDLTLTPLTRVLAAASLSSGSVRD